MFYTYNQNNSGGAFEETSGIAQFVIIEANSADEANERAIDAGIYFDEEYQIDCDCCGTRWDTFWGNPDEVPSVYGDPVADGEIYMRYPAWTSPAGYIHYLDGRVESFEVRTTEA